MPRKFYIIFESRNCRNIFLKKMTKYLFYAIIETKKGYLMKIRVPAAMLAVIMIIAAFPVSAAQMARYYRSKRSSYPSAYKSLGAATINDFTRIVYNEAKRYNIRAEVLFAQMMNETGFLKFGGDVSIYQCNFGGVGAVGNGASGLDFRSYAAAHYKAFGYSSASQAEKHAIEVGIRSQAMHLSLYAGAIRRIDNTIDPRGRYVRVGNAGSE